MTSTTPRRRERVREQTSHEIRERALALLADGGPQAISLRAIARQMGMTAGAIYSYFATRDDLVNALMDDVYDDLAGVVETARDQAPADPAARLTAWALAFRDWAVGRPAGFRLIYGDAVPGYVPGPDTVAAAADRRMCSGLAGLVSALRASRALPTTADLAWRDFDDDLVHDVRTENPGTDPDALALTLRAWGRMHGLVALEVYGHLGTQTSVAEQLYVAEIKALSRDLSDAAS